jgi:hypothetical protein
LPGILTGTASLLTAVTGLWLALSGNEPAKTPPTGPDQSTTSTVPPKITGCEPTDKVSDPEHVGYTFGLIFSGAYDTQPDVKDLAILNLRKQLCGPLVKRGYTASAVYKMSPAELMAAATEEGLMRD